MNTIADVNATSTNAQWQARKDKAIAVGEANLAPVYIEKGKNALLWDVEGNRYVDFASGIAVTNTGHSHPRIVAAVKEQVERFSHTCVMVTPYNSAVVLAEKLNELAPGNTPKKSMFVTTGAEAVENAIKIARAHTRRRAVIAFNGGYHGRTNFTLGLTGKNAPYKTLFGPFPADIYRVPFPIPYHGVTEEQSIEALHNLFNCDITPEEVAAIIIEPVQGEGGFYPASNSFLRVLREICTQHGIVMIADEIQTGFGRTGKLFASEHADIEPDLITVAKGMAGGFPIAAVIGKTNIMDAASAGGLGGTYAGSPISCAAALAVLDIIEDEQLVARSLQIGIVFSNYLRELQKEYPDLIGEVRADRGAMVAIELVKNGDPSQPNSEFLGHLIKEALNNGLILLKCGIRNNVVRFLPPLTIEDEIVEEGLNLFKRAFESVAK